MNQYLTQSVDQPAPDLFYYNSVGGDWVEVYYKSDGKVEILHTMFWKGSGYIPKHKHHCAEKFQVLKGKGIYFIENKGYLYTNHQKVLIPEGVYHINPMNHGDMPLVVLYEDVDRCQLDFYEKYYQQIDQERFVKNKRGLPTWRQLFTLNKVLNYSSCFYLGWFGSIFNLFYQRYR